MLTIRQIRKLDRTPSDKQLAKMGYHGAVDGGTWWSNGFVAFHEPLPPSLEAQRERDISDIVVSAETNSLPVYPVRIQSGYPKSQTRLDSPGGDSFWINTKYLLAAAKKGRNATAFFASNRYAHHPIACHNAAGELVGIIMPLSRTAENFDPEWSLQNTDMP